MPNKSHRAASRQAQLRRRRRRGKGQPQVFAQGPTESKATADVSEPAVEPAIETEPLARVPQPARRSRQQAAAEPMPVLAYRYLRAELRRIGVITALIFGILAVLTAVLRG